MIQITLKDSSTGSEVTRNYATDMFAVQDVEKIGEKVWCMYETVSAPESDNPFIKAKPDELVENEIEDMMIAINEERGDLEDAAKDSFNDK